VTIIDRPPIRRGGDELPVSAVMRALPFKIPAHLARIAEEAAERAERGEVDHNVSGPVEASEEAKRQQALVRRDALDKALTAKRENCRAGLSVLHPDQYPGELQAWLDDPYARTLLLAGRTGCGKTQAAFAAAAQAARYGAMTTDKRTGAVLRRPLIVRAWPVNQYLRELMPEGSPEPIWSVRHRAVWAELLILDDLGAELDDVATSFMRKEIADLLDARLERWLRTIFTTNHEPKVVETRLGERLWSRLSEDSTALAFRGPDRRTVKPLTW